MALLLSTVLLTLFSFSALCSFSLFPMLPLPSSRAVLPSLGQLWLGWRWGWDQDLTGRVVALCLLSLVREQGFPCLNLSGQGTKQKEGAELYNEPITGGMVCRKGCVYKPCWEECLTSDLQSLIPWRPALILFTFSAFHFLLSVPVYGFVQLYSTSFLPFPSVWLLHSNQCSQSSLGDVLR